MQKTIIITGGNRGLGLETAKQLSDQGYRLILGIRKESELEATAATFKENGTPVLCYQLDLSSSNSINDFVAFVQKEVGGIDGLINNAGVLLDADSPDFINTTQKISDNTLRKTFDINFFGTIELTNKLIPAFTKNSLILNISSILGSNQFQADAASPIYEVKTFGYNASKAALNSYTIHLAHALAPMGIRVNSVHPGWVKTDMGGENAPLSTQEGAKAIVEQVRFDQPLTGKFVHQDGQFPW
ncbi:MAG TPA: short-chain dehydrogenase [Cytophagales bacterium]|nr:short-chain dehydrogenase [Cytophagales bacterium]HAA23613.1 short-chain dehydrogenase [Cytophagales bacterium]HAP60755.1 short-chain dehydrogenase [Cytophagales bacterium]